MYVKTEFGGEEMLNGFKIRKMKFIPNGEIRKVFTLELEGSRFFSFMDKYGRYLRPFMVP